MTPHSMSARCTSSSDDERKQLGGHHFVMKAIMLALTITEVLKELNHTFGRLYAQEGRMVVVFTDRG